MELSIDKANKRERKKEMSRPNPSTLDSSHKSSVANKSLEVGEKLLSQCE